MIRVLVADDHEVIRRGLRLLIRHERDLQCVGLACDGVEAVMMAQATVPDVVVMDLSMPGLDGLAAARELKLSHPHIKVLALTFRTDMAWRTYAVHAGVVGYLSKQTHARDIAEAIRCVSRGEVPVGSLVPLAATTG
jgi:two-component system, NarL family, response regulator NreC